MKIANVTTHLVCLPFSSGSTVAWRGFHGSTLDHVLVRIDTDNGITGWGDAFGYGAASATKAALDHIIAPTLIGRDATDIGGINHALQVENHLWGRYGVMMFAISGVDIALWDIAGQSADLPLHRLLGGARRKHLPAYASLFKYNDAEQVGERVTAALEQGFRHVKLHETGEDEVRAARNAAGNQTPIMVDTNCPWTPAQAHANALKLKPYDLFWLEEPLFPPEDFQGLASLGRNTGIPLAAGENACTAFEFKKMIDAKAVSYLQPSVTKVGGITEMRKVIALAEANSVTVVPHSPYFGPGLLATLHVLSTLSDDALAEFFFYSTMEANLYGDSVLPHNGVMNVPQGPGLGYAPDQDVIKEYAVPA